MIDEPKLLRCGCGGEPFLLDGYRVLCLNCLITTDYKNSEAEAITAWNTAIGSDARKIAEDIAHDIVVNEQLAKKIKMKPKRAMDFTYECPNCRAKVGYTEGTGYIFVGGSESYEDWRTIRHNFCPKCGIKIDWDTK